MSWSWFTLGFCIFLTLAIINSEIFVTLNDKFEDCTKDGPARIVDFSELSFDYVNDTTFFINGKKFLLTELMKFKFDLNFLFNRKFKISKADQKSMESLHLHRKI